MTIQSRSAKQIGLGAIILAALLIIFNLTCSDSIFYEASLKEHIYTIHFSVVGLIAGCLIGPILLPRFRPEKFLITGVMGGIITAVCFVLLSLTKLNIFYIAIATQIIFGFFAGLIVNLMWYIALGGQNNKINDKMLVVLFTIRAIASWCGIPFLVSLIIINSFWQAAVLFCLFFILILGIFLIPSTKKLSNATLKRNSIWQEIKDLFTHKYSTRFWFGILLNSISYVALYKFAELRFTNIASSNLLKFSEMVLAITIAEVIAIFCAPWLYRTCNYKKTITVVGIGSVIFWIILATFAAAPLPMILLMGSAFIIFDRFFFFAIVRNIPFIFSQHKNKATLGSLVTAIRWIGFFIVLGIQKYGIPPMTISVIDTISLVTITTSVGLLWYVEKKILFPKISTFIPNTITTKRK